MNEQDFAELSAGAALNALSPDDGRRFRDALAAHPEWRAIAEADAETSELLSAAAVPETPPAAIREALLGKIATVPQGAGSPVDGEAARTPRRWTRAVFALAACLAVLVGVGTIVVNNHLNRPSSVVALEQITASADAEKSSVELADGGTATAHWSPSSGDVVLVADGIAAPSEGHTYQLWFVRGDTPVSAGVFSVDDGRATAELHGDMHAGDIIAVTVEQAGGSPTGAPTTEPVIVIPTA